MSATASGTQQLLLLDLLEANVVTNVSRPDCALDQALHISLVSHRVYLACGASAQKHGTAGLLLAPR